MVSVAMPQSIARQLANGARRLAAAAAVRRFVRRKDGSVAVEFAMVAAPFFALLFAIMETAIVFFAGQALETAVGDSARLIMTGQANFQNNFSYNPGGPGDIVVVRLFYQYPVYVSLLGFNLSNVNGGKRLLAATAAFRNASSVSPAISAASRPSNSRCCCR